MDDQLGHIKHDFVQLMGKIEALIGSVEANLTIREDEINKKLSLVKLAEARMSELENLKISLRQEQDILEKEKIALRDKAQTLAIREQKLKEKVQQTQAMFQDSEVL